METFEECVVSYERVKMAYEAGRKTNGKTILTNTLNKLWRVRGKTSDQSKIQACDELSEKINSLINENSQETQR